MDIVVIGAGGYGRGLRSWLRRAVDRGAPWNVLGYVDDNPRLQGEMIGDDPVLGELAWLRQNPGMNVVLGIGLPFVKWRILDRLATYNLRYPPLVDASAVLGDRVTFDEGTTVVPGVVMDPDVKLGRFVTVNMSATVGHDSNIGAFSTLSPGVNLSGYTMLAEGVDMGAGAVTIPGQSVGAWSIVGAGAVVTTPLPANVVAVGVPAKAIKTRTEGWHRA